MKSAPWSQKVKSERAIKIAQLFLIKVTYFFKIVSLIFNFRDRFYFLGRPFEDQDGGGSFYQDQKDQAFQDPFSLSVIDATFSFCWSHFLDQVVSILYHGNAF